MAKQISKEGVADVIQNVRNPLVSIYDKMQAKGGQKLGFSDIKEEFDWIMKFTKDVEEWQETGVNDPTVIVNNKVYKPSEV